MVATKAMPTNCENICGALEVPLVTGGGAQNSLFTPSLGKMESKYRISTAPSRQINASKDTHGYDIHLYSGVQ